MTYVDDYVSRLNAIKAARQTSELVGLPSGPSKSDLANLILRKAQSEFQISTPVAKPESKDDRGIWGGVKSVGQGILDILSRPLYAVGESVDSAINEPDPSVGSVAKGAWEGISGKEKTDWIEVIKNRAKNHIIDDNTAEVVRNLRAEGKEDEAQSVIAKYQKDIGDSKILSASGLGLDLVLDPINLVPGGVFTKPFTLAGKGIRALSKTDDAIKASEAVLGVEKAANGASDPVSGLLKSTPGEPIPAGQQALPPGLTPETNPQVISPTQFKIPVQAKTNNVPFPRAAVPNLPEFVTEATTKEVERTIPGGVKTTGGSKQRASLAKIVAPIAGLTGTSVRAGALSNIGDDVLKQAEDVITARRIRMRNGLPPVMTPHEAAFADIWDDLAGATGRAKTDLSHLTPQKFAQSISDDASGIRLSKKNAKGAIVSGPTIPLKVLHSYLTGGEAPEDLGDLYVKFKGEKVPLRTVKNLADSEARSGEYLLRVKSERSKFSRADPSADKTGTGLRNLVRGVAQYELNPARYAYRETENPEFFGEFRKVESALKRRGITDDILAEVKDAYADIVAANRGKALPQEQFTKFIENVLDEYDPDLLGPKGISEVLPPKTVKETVTTEKQIFPDKDLAGIASALRNDERFISLPNLASGKLSSSAFKAGQKEEVLNQAAALVDEVGQGAPEAIKALNAPVAKSINPEEAASVTSLVAKTIDTIKSSNPVKSATNTRPRHKAYNAPKQSNLSNQIANEASSIFKTANPKITNPHSPKFIPALYGSYTRMLKTAEDALIATGKDSNMPRLGNGASGDYIRLSDVLERLGPTLGRQAVFGPKGKILMTKLLNAIGGDKAALEAIKKSNEEVWSEVMLNNWTDLMAKEHALRAIADTSMAKPIVDDAADAIQAKKTDPLLSESAKADGIKDITDIAKTELKNSMPQTKSSMVDLLRSVATGPKSQISIVDQVLESRKAKLAAGILKPKEAQAPRIEVVKATNQEIAGDISQVKHDPNLAANLGEAGPFSTVIKWFNPAYGYADLRPLLLKNVGVRKASAAVRAHDIKNIFAGFPIARHPEIWDAATGQISAADENVERAAMMIQKVMGNIFVESGLKDAAAGNTAMARAGVTVDDLNKHLRIVGVDDKFRFTGKHVDPNTGTDVILEGLDILDSWRYSKPTNPQEFMFNLTQAAENAMVEYSTWANIGSNFGSKTAGKGLVEVANMHPAIDGMHFPQDIAQEMSKVADGIDEFYEPLSNNKFIKMYDQALRTWKSGVTIYAPSHHIRNMIGDMFMGWLDGVNNPKYYSRAGKVILSQRNRYSDVIGSDKLPMGQLLGAGREKEIMDELMVGGRMPKGSHIMATARIGRKSYKLTADQVYQMGFRHGLFPRSNVIEDLPGSETLLEALARKNPKAQRVFQPLGGKGQTVAREISESREHVARMAHYLHALEHTKADSLEDLFYKSAQRVRKYHPDGLDLTKAEKTVLRRLFPFYSWTRKAIPLILEGIVTNPHKIMAYPKIQHGLAESQGIENTEISTPYPEDQLFPDWLAGNVIGPMFDPTSRIASFFARSPGEEGYVIANPGNPATDIFEDFFNNPAKGALGSLTPGIKMPIEMLSGTDLQTGAPIKDKTEYLDKNIPMLSVVSRLTNGGVGTGLVEGGDLKGKETDPVNTAGLINFLTAAGILDTGRYVKGGEFDLREYLRKQSAGTN